MKFTALPSDIVHALQAGGPDAYGHAPEITRSDGAGNPCRHCLEFVPTGADMLILAHRPFADLQPYAETGPIFLCAAPCARGGGDVDADALPEVLRSSPDYLLKGYGTDDRIIYGTGAIVPPAEIAGRAAQLFADPQVAYLHLRSARNNCYLARIDRN